LATVITQILGDFALGQRDTDRDQDQPGEEHDWNGDEDQQPDVGIVHARAAEVERQYEKPRKSC
jgi:hypothetical protein